MDNTNYIEPYHCGSPVSKCAHKNSETAQARDLWEQCKHLYKVV